MIRVPRGKIKQKNHYHRRYTYTCSTLCTQSLTVACMESLQTDTNTMENAGERERMINQQKESVKSEENDNR